MASNERKRQDKLARKAGKRKQHKEAQQRSTTASAQGMSAAGQMALVSRHGDLDRLLEGVRGYQDHGDELLGADAPIHACLVPAGLFESGIGNVIVSRKLSDGRILVADFLLDVWCLGVKNAFVKVGSASEYSSLLRNISEHEHLNPIDPACARKLVEEADAYAADLGFGPHPDYQVSRRIFGDIDVTACRTRYRFGKDGKPFYASGPYDTEAKSKRIVDTLMQRCGPGGFHYLVALGGLEDLDAWTDVEDAGEEELIEGEVVEEDRSLEEGESTAPRSWLRRLPPFRR